MRGTIMHGNSAIVFIALTLMFMVPLLAYLRKTPRNEWRVTQSVLFGLGLVIFSIGVSMISLYRVWQAYFLSDNSMFDLITSASLGFVFGGGCIIIYSATLEKGRWKRSLVAGVLALWIIVALIWPA